MQWFLDACYYVTLFLLPIALYVLFFKTKNSRFYADRDLFYIVKLVFATRAVKNYQAKCSPKEATKHSLEHPKPIEIEIYNDNHFIYGADQKGNSLSLRFSLRAELIAEVFVCLRLATGAIYTFPGKPSKLYSLSGWRWKTKELQIEVLEAFKRLRLTFNGLLRNASGAVEHVKFNFIWVAAARPRFHPRDAATGLLVDALCQTTWKDGDWISLLGDERGYEQFGALHGRISGDSFPDELPLNLASCRCRFWGTTDELAVHRYIHLFVAANDGALVSLWVKSIKDGVELKHGSSITSSGVVFAVDDTDVSLKSVGMIPPTTFTVHVSAGGRVLRGVFHVDQSSGVRSGGLVNLPAECDVNTQQAAALVEFWWNPNRPREVPPPPLIVRDTTATLPGCYVVRLDDERAKIVRLSGGKGSSLAILASLKSPRFLVPDGFIVTVNAFSRQLEANAKLAEMVAILDGVCCGRIAGDLSQACVTAVTAVKNEEIVREVREAIVEALHEDVGHRWAVRSSAVGEDGEDVSAAGQNATFLGCGTVEDVIDAVAACWASLFTFQSVQYRHQYGLPVASQMAVVVQRMVPSQCAGVLFTCHPSTANPAHLVITSNYGLGESVVSGRSDPDTIVLQRTFDQQLTIKSKTLGLKNEIIWGEGHVDEDLAEFSITDEQALLLGRVGVLWEGLLGHALDVEWAFSEGKLHLLQARPITTLRTWSDDELLHEFDSATLSEDVVFTGANVGEILPGAISTLALTTSVRGIEMGTQKSIGIHDADAFKCLPTFQHHLFADVVRTIHIHVSKSIDLTSKIVDLAIFGHPVINSWIHSLSVARNGVVGVAQQARNLLTMITLAWRNERHVKEAAQLARGVDVGVDEHSDSLKDMYVKIDKYLQVYERVLYLHCLVTRTSVSYQIAAMMVLAENSSDFTGDHYTDIAMLMSSCDDVVSAQVPATLARIAATLTDAGLAHEFCAIAPDVGRAWLETHSTRASEIFGRFLAEHGHRAMREFDIAQTPWRDSPADVIRIIQANCRRGSPAREKTTKCLDDIVAELKSPTRSSTRKILKFLIGKGRRAVSCREQTKSESVRCADRLRTAYGILARQMALRGLVPDARLVFYLSHHEVARIIAGSERAPVLITKALKRRRLHPKWNRLTFPEISYGIPRPERREFVASSSGCGVKCEGTPVCAGTVQARACVVMDLDQIDQLQEGDVLITYCTDIGWSPYFPMLGGIVTELGGLVSHGAVIAREYGLPCIVGAQGATTMFQTGNVVLLSGKNGTVELVTDSK